ncbi:SHOCT domain-containing protein [Phaeacidiphilus oryzae]|uniref:SHOCT domain-containing protein n=1 Tax=Phaeacidiphilus oryzae TaxID=348818 RepID=UPI0005616CF2|nr:SHOCT domain-containing protein [Phaeacidiphilus oryzae]
MSNYPLLDLFWTMLEFFVWVLWFFLLFKVISDVFRSHDMGGGAKALWIVCVILLPFLGVLVYVIVRGRSMGERDRAAAKQNEEAVRAYIRDAAGGGDAGSGSGGGGDSHVNELRRLADLRREGALSEEEFQKAKDKLLNA